MAPSRHDWKIADWDIKPQYEQTTHFNERMLCTPHTQFATGIVYCVDVCT